MNYKVTFTGSCTMPWQSLRYIIIVIVVLMCVALPKSELPCLLNSIA